MRSGGLALRGDRGSGARGWAGLVAVRRGFFARATHPGSRPLSNSLSHGLVQDCIKRPRRAPCYLPIDGARAPVLRGPLGSASEAPRPGGSRIRVPGCGVGTWLPDGVDGG